MEAAELYVLSLYFSIKWISFLKANCWDCKEGTWVRSV